MRQICLRRTSLLDSARSDPALSDIRISYNVFQSFRAAIRAHHVFKPLYAFLSFCTTLPLLHNTIRAYLRTFSTIWQGERVYAFKCANMFYIKKAPMCMRKLAPAYIEMCGFPHYLSYHVLICFSTEC